MSTNVPENKEDQEIDLVQVFKKIGHFFERINTGIFSCIQFFIKNAVIILILLVIGVGLGFYFDKSKKTFDNKIIVMPNFESTNYLYSKINLISTKINEKDYVFLKEEVGIKEPQKLLKIEIKPIADVYKFVQNRTENFELLKLIAENGDINKIIQDDITSKNYPFHLISFSTDALTSDSETIQPLLKYLNNSEYYTKIRKVYISNIQDKMVQNDSIIGQINGLLNVFNKTVKGSQKSSSLVYYNENTQLNDVIKTKEALITEQGNHKLELVSYDTIIKDISITTNSKNSNGINGKLKLVLPALFLLLFILIHLFRAYYRKQLQKMNIN